MTGFIASGLLVSFIFGTFICLVSVSNSKRKWLGWLVGITISLVFGFGFVGALAMEQEWDREAWNNGYCECGGSFELSAATKSKMGSKTFYYTCGDCGHTIETSRLMR